MEYVERYYVEEFELYVLTLTVGVSGMGDETKARNFASNRKLSEFGAPRELRFVLDKMQSVDNCSSKPDSPNFVSTTLSVLQQ